MLAGLGSGRAADGGVAAGGRTWRLRPGMPWCGLAVLLCYLHVWWSCGQGRAMGGMAPDMRRGCALVWVSCATCVSARGEAG